MWGDSGNDFRMAHPMADGIALTDLKSAPHSSSAARVFAVVPCAGSGSRAGAAVPKQYQAVAGQAVVLHTLAALHAVVRVQACAVVVAPGDDTWSDRAHPFGSWLRLVPRGGATRAHSVLAGLLALAEAGAAVQDWVLVHDAARCLVTPKQVNALIDACMDDAVGGLLALPLPDTLKQAQAGRVAATVPREAKWLAQTPQMFRLGVLTQALQQAAASDFAGITDESSAMEAMGFQPLLVTGSAQNIKITYPEDFALAQAVLESRQP